MIARAAACGPLRVGVVFFTLSMGPERCLYLSQEANVVPQCCTAHDAWPAASLYWPTTCHTAAVQVLASAEETCPRLVGTAQAANRMKQSLQTLQLAPGRRWLPGY